MHLLPEPLFVLPTDSLQTRTLAGTDNGRSVLLLAVELLDPDPHYFELLDPDPQSVLLLAGLRIRIRIILSCWIRIRNQCSFSQGCGSGSALF